MVQMIYGYPGEDRHTIEETARFFDRVKFYPATASGQITPEKVPTNRATPANTT